VIAGARPGDHARCIEAGADAVVDFAEAGLVERFEEVAPDGVDVYWNTSPHQNFDIAVRVVRLGGHIIVTSGTDTTATIPVRQFYARDMTLDGFVVFRATSSELAGAATLINAMLDAGALTANIAEELPLSATAEVHRRIERGDVRGRVIFRPRM